MKQFILLSVLLLLLVTGCQAPTTLTSPSTTEAELAAVFSQNTNSYTDMFFRTAMPAMAMLENAADDSAASVKSYSTTNVQVAGIDEADIIKTDGEYLYIVQGNDLFIVEAGDSARVVSTTPVEYSISSLFIQDNTLVLFGQEFNDDIYYAESFFAPYSSTANTVVEFFDLSDVTAPTLQTTYTLEGNYYTARLSDGQIILVLQGYRNSERPIPLIMRNGVESSFPVDDIRILPHPYTNPVLVSTYSFTLTGEQLDQEAVVMDSLQTVYVSQNNIYLAGTQYINEYEIREDIFEKTMQSLLTDEDEDLIELIESTSEKVLTSYEKESKISQIYYKRLASFDRDEQEDIQDGVDKELKKQLSEINYFVTTELVMLSYGEAIELQAQTTLPGQLLNQFSLDEANNRLRVATTIPQRWSSYTEKPTESSSQVHLLDMNLKTIGSLENIAPTETIYSSRFTEDRLYLVTFRQVDPLFVIDLTGAKPDILGELKITGYSSYLHIVDDTTLLGFGQETTETGRITGLKISLFDISDVTKPREVAKWVSTERYASSEALYEHKAFLFDKEKELLVLPVQHYSWDENDDSYSGALVFLVNDEIALRGLIDHSQDASKYYYTTVQRSLYIGNELYTLSQGLLRVNDLATLGGLVDVKLEGSKDIGIPIY